MDEYGLVLVTCIYTYMNIICLNMCTVYIYIYIHYHPAVDRIVMDMSKGCTICQKWYPKVFPWGCPKSSVSLLSWMTMTTRKKVKTVVTTGDPNFKNPHIIYIYIIYYIYIYILYYIYYIYYIIYIYIYYIYIM